jgi:hypothetical protein
MTDEIVTPTSVPEPEVSIPEVTPAPFVPTAGQLKLCRHCGKEFDQRGTAAKACDTCRANPPKGAPKKKGRVAREGSVLAGKAKGSPELKEAHKIHKRLKRIEERTEKESAAELIGSDHEPGDQEAKEILREAGVRNPHVLDVLISHAKVACAHYQIPYNRYVLQHGLRKTLADLKAEPFDVPVIGEDEIDGEIVFKRDLYYLWDFGYWRNSATFSEWLEIRFQAKSSAYFLGKEILGLDLHELHQKWSEFFPQFSPLGLKPGFPMDGPNGAKAWLGRQSTSKTFCLVCSRSSYKSSFAAILALVAIISQPSIRLRYVTSVDDLASDFVAAIRRYFVVDNPDEPTLFAQLFGEFCITPDTGKTDVYSCPMRHLKNIVADTLVSSSMSSKQVGRRCEVLLVDDAQDQDAVATSGLREKGMNRFDLLGKLVEVGGYIISLSTFWDREDITATLIARAKADPDTLTAVRVDPAWEVLPHASRKAILELTETDVVLAFPERLTFKFLMGEAKKNLKQFKSQNLCEIPDDEDAGAKIHFDIDQLHAAVRSPSYFDQSNPALELIGTYSSLDAGWSVLRFADYSAQIVCRVFRDRRSGKFILGVVDIKMEQLRIQELAQSVCGTFKIHPDIKECVVEKSGSWQSLAMAITNEARETRQFPAPVIYWKTIGTIGQKNKMGRIRALEAPLATGQLLFKSGMPLLDDLFVQLVNCTGARSGTSLSKKDDGPDALAILAERSFFPLFTHIVKTEAEIDDENTLAGQRFLAAQHDWMWGTTGQQPQPRQDEEQEPDSVQVRFGFRR